MPPGAGDDVVILHNVTLSSSESVASVDVQAQTLRQTTGVLIVTGNFSLSGGAVPRDRDKLGLFPDILDCQHCHAKRHHGSVEPLGGGGLDDDQGAGLGTAGRLIGHTTAGNDENPRPSRPGVFVISHSRATWRSAIPGAVYFPISPGTLTIQSRPNLSVSMPNFGDQKVFASGMVTFPPWTSALKAFSASASVATDRDSVTP